MGTVPTPLQPPASSVLNHNQTDSWYNTLAFLLKPPACRAYSNATQTISPSSSAFITFGADDFNNVQAGDTNMHSTSTNPDRVTIKTAGRYEVTVTIQANTAGLNVVLYKNGSAAGSGNTMAASFSSQQETRVFVTSMQLLAADYLQVQLNTGASTATIIAAYPCSIYVKWISN